MQYGSLLSTALCIVVKCRSAPCSLQCSPALFSPLQSGTLLNTVQQCRAPYTTLHSAVQHCGALYTAVQCSGSWIQCLAVQFAAVSSAVQPSAAGTGKQSKLRRPPVQPPSCPALLRLAPARSCVAPPRCNYFPASLVVSTLWGRRGIGTPHAATARRRRPARPHPHCTLQPADCAATKVRLSVDQLCGAERVEWGPGPVGDWAMDRGYWPGGMGRPTGSLLDTVMAVTMLGGQGGEVGQGGGEEVRAGHMGLAGGLSQSDRRQCKHGCK